MSVVPQITPKEAKEKLENSSNFMILDVREKKEIDFVSIDDFIHIKMRDISIRYGELPKDKEIGVLCRSGARSGRVTVFLREQGYNAYNITGGILNWSDTIDKSLPKYKIKNSQISKFE